VAEVVLQAASVHALVCQLVPAGVPQHVGMHAKWHLGGLPKARDHPAERIACRPRHNDVDGGDEREARRLNRRPRTRPPVAGVALDFFGVWRCGWMDMPSVDFVGIAVAALVLAICALVMWLGRP
jgi:hypothetical protein